MDLPTGTDSINIPKVATGTAVGYQQANNTGVVTQDWTDTVITANVKTIAGVAPTQTAGGGMAVTIVEGAAITDYSGTGITVTAVATTGTFFSAMPPAQTIRLTRTPYFLIRSMIILAPKAVASMSAR